MESTILEFDAKKFFDEFIKVIHLFPSNEGRQWIYRGQYSNQGTNLAKT